jgi:hypothetical protein
MGRAMGWQASPSQGYYQGVPEGPFAGGQGSMAGPKLQGLGFLAAGQGAPGSAGSWDPTIVYLLLLTIGEMVVFGVISRMLR